MLFQSHVAHAVLTRAVRHCAALVCRHAHRVIGTMLSDAETFDKNVSIPDVLRQDNGRLAERMDRAVSAVRSRRRRSNDGPTQLIEHAEVWKESGNGEFRAGQLSRAATSYSRAVDVLHALPSTDGLSSTLPRPVQELLATCLSNRAQVQQRSFISPPFLVIRTILHA